MLKEPKFTCLVHHQVSFINWVFQVLKTLLRKKEVKKSERKDKHFKQKN